MDGARSAEVLEIEAALRDALALHGVSGSVIVQGSEVELRSAGSPVSIEIQGLVGQWSLLPADMRHRKAGDLARRLVAAQRASTPDATRVTKSGRPVARPLVIPLGGIALFAVLGVALWLTYARGEGGPHAAASAAPLAPESPQQVAARKVRACEAARHRLYSGASMGPFVPEGWVAELWLARWKGDDDLAQDPAVARLLDGTKLAPSADAAISAVTDGAVTIESGLPEDGAVTAVVRSGLTLRFSGGYAGAFFDPQMRPRFLAFADRTAEAVSADAGALYARCEHLRFHDVGVWFRGSDRASAAAALVYGIGAFAASPAIDRGALEVRAVGELEALHLAARGLDAADLAEAIGSQGGSITTSDARPGLTIVFPLFGGTRAISASRSVARKIGAGVGSE